jgi:uncharacterized membrane protein
VKSELVLLHFENPAAAERTMSTIRTLEAEGFVELEDAALITRASDGEVEVSSLQSGDGRTKPALGAVVGLIAGGLVGLPVLGALAVGGVAAKKSVDAAVKELDQLLDDVGRRVDAGSAALALSVRSMPQPDIVADRLSIHRDEMTRVEIPPELRAELDAHRRPD